MARKKSVAAASPTLDLDRYAPSQIVNLATRYSRSASQLYLHLYGVGITEWRIISILTYERNITANRIVSIISTNKAAISRALNELEAGEYVVLKAALDDNRKRLIELTPKGYWLHDQLLPLALKRESLLLDGFSSDEVDTLLGFLARMNKSLPVVEAHDRSLIKKDAKRPREEPAL